MKNFGSYVSMPSWSCEVLNRPKTELYILQLLSSHSHSVFYLWIYWFPSAGMAEFPIKDGENGIYQKRAGRVLSP